MTACAHLMQRNHTHPPIVGGGSSIAAAVVQKPDTATSSEASGEDASSSSLSKTGPTVASDEELSDMMRYVRMCVV